MKGDTAKKRRRRLGAAGELSDEEAGELGELPAAERSSDEEEVGERLGGCTWGGMQSRRAWPVGSELQEARLGAGGAAGRLGERG